MRLEIKSTDIKCGDLVIWNNEGGTDVECLVLYDHGDTSYPWLLVDVSNCNIIEAYINIIELSKNVTLIAKEDKIKLVVEH